MKQGSYGLANSEALSMGPACVPLISTTGSLLPGEYIQNVRNHTMLKFGSEGDLAWTLRASHRVGHSI